MTRAKIKRIRDEVVALIRKMAQKKDKEETIPSPMVWVCF